jgi:hypothetical protein
MGMNILIATVAVFFMAIGWAIDGLELKRLRKEVKELKNELSKCRNENR